MASSRTGERAPVPLPAGVAASTGSLYDLGLPTEEAVSALASMGVRDVEVYLQGAPEMSRGYVQRLSDRCQEAGVRVGSVHPYVFGFENLLHTTYRRQQRWALLQFERYLQICAELKATYYVAHGPPRHHVVHDGRISDRYRAITTELVEMANAHGVRYCIENVSYGLLRDMADVEAHREALDVPVPLVLDVKSAWKAGLRPQDFASALSKEIAFVHLSFPDHANARYGVCPVGDIADPDLSATVGALMAEHGAPGRAVVEVCDAPDLRAVESAVVAAGLLLTPHDPQAVAARQPSVVDNL